MSAIPRLNGWDKYYLCCIVSSAVEWTVENYRDLEKVAERFSGGSVDEAFKDCLDKGLSAFLTMCDMDDYATEAGL